MDGVWGMRKFSSEELFEIAKDYEHKLRDPENTDDPKWLKRRINRITLLAEQKEKAKEHKKSQNK